MSLLGIDVGVQGCALLAVSRDGRSLTRVSREYRSQVRSDGACELDVREVWTALSEAVREVVSQTALDPIHALAISSAGDAITPLAITGQPLDACLLGEDGRGAQTLSRLERALGRDRVFDITGRTPGSAPVLARLCWLCRQRAELYQATWRFVFLGGLISHLFGASATCDYSLASSAFLLDTRQRRWAREILATCDLDSAKLPELAEAGSPLGVVAPQVARELGLRSGVRVVLGGHERACSALGAGVVHRGQGAYILGNTGHLATAFNAIPLSSLLLQQGLSMEHHVAPDLFLCDVYNRSGGAVLRWFADTLAPLEKREAAARNASVYNVLLAEMPDEPTPLTVIPRLAPTGPPKWDANPLGALIGLRLDTTRGEILRALLEGVTCYFADARQVLERVGIPTYVCRAMGGGARSSAWLQLSADILGVSVERTHWLNPAPLGAAMLAGVGCGDYADLEQAAAALVRVEARFDPEPRRQAQYAERLERYRAFDTLLRKAPLDS